MNELKKKMFLTLFFSFTALVVAIVGLNNYQTWLSAREDLEHSLHSIAKAAGQLLNPNEMGPWSAYKKNHPDLDELALISDNPAWIVSLDISGEPTQIYTSSLYSTDIERVVEETRQITRTHEPGSQYLGSLYTGGFGWDFVSGRSLILIDTGRIQQQLLKNLAVSAGIALLFEAGLFLICRKVTNWMIAPIEQSMERQKQFIADASHELKTPLAVILANAEAMEQDPSGPWLENIKEESERMSGLITSLLDLTRAQQRKPELSRIDLSRLVEKQCLIMEAVLFERNLELKEEIAPAQFVLAESPALQQLCSILLDNAAAHSEGLIEVRVFPSKKDVMFEVSNLGQPVPKEEREKIFERFYRADSSRNRQSQRYGLGLAIAKSIVDSHQGKIGIRCENGMTTFWVRFRAAAGEEEKQKK